jgi:hypothetical protein
LALTSKGNFLFDGFVKTKRILENELS